MMTDSCMHRLFIIASLVAFETVAVNAIMFTFGRIDLNSDKFPYSVLKSDPPHKRQTTQIKSSFKECGCGCVCVCVCVHIKSCVC